MIKNIEEFVNNRYYMCRIINDNEPDFIYYFKYRKIIINKYSDKEIDFYWETYPPNNDFKEKTYKSTLFPFHDYGEMRKKYIYTEVDFSEIIKYLPSGHPDIIEYRKERIKSLLSNNL